MILRDTFPESIMEMENTWIPMPDGVRLAARIWIPETAPSHPVPAILEFIPYRKRDGMALRDERMHPWFAGHGYAAVRVDLRGTGDSGGLLEDEYTLQEQQDGLAVIDWLSRQGWCSGAVGMIGISWGGFNGLQIAAHHPPALRAVISVGSTDDRYADDVHYMGGVQLSSNFTWSQTFLSDMTRPPDPAIVGEDWRRIWLDRLENQTFFIDRWLAHPTRDAYWGHGSVCTDYARITCPVLAVGGWADSYTNSVARLMSGLPGPRLGIIGPWGHDYPHTALPGPAIGFLQECLRWWDHWLKDRDTGIMQEPPLRVFVQEQLSVDPSHEMRDGRWIGLDPMQPVTAPPLCLHLTPDGLRPAPATDGRRMLSSPQTLGAASGEWCPYGRGADQPADQAADDGLSLCFDTRPLTEPIEIHGTPILRLRISSDAPAGMIVARLNEVDEHGRSARISYGVLNLKHRESFAESQPMQPGVPTEIELPLCDTSYRFTPGRRIRLALSTTYWPTLWPMPQPFCLSLDLADCALSLPLLDPGQIVPTAVSFASAEASMPGRRTQLHAPEMRRQMLRDYVTDSEEIEVIVDDGVERIETHGLELGRRCVERYRIDRDDPLSARMTADWRMTMRRGDWSVRTETRSVMTQAADGFHLECSIEAYEGDARVFHRDLKAVHRIRD